MRRAVWRGTGRLGRPAAIPRRVLVGPASSSSNVNGIYYRYFSNWDGGEDLLGDELERAVRSIKMPGKEEKTDIMSVITEDDSQKTRPAVPLGDVTKTKAVIEEQTNQDAEIEDEEVDPPKISKTKMKKMNHVWKKHIRCYEELEPEYARIEKEMISWADNLDSMQINHLNEKEEAYFWALTTDRDPDVFPKTRELPFPTYIEQWHVYQELVDLPIPNIVDTTFEKYKTVKIYMKVSEMGLDEFEQEVLKELVGKRYCADRDELKLVCRQFPSRETNLEGVKKLAWEVYEEAKRLAEELRSKPEYYEEEVELPMPPRERKLKDPFEPRPLLRQTRYNRGEA